MTTSPSEVKRGRGRPPGVKNSVKRKPATKKVVINTEAIIANSEVKKLTSEVIRLKEELSLANDAFVAVEEQHKTALIVIGYLEGKIFKS